MLVKVNARRVLSGFESQHSVRASGPSEKLEVSKVNSRYADLGACGNCVREVLKSARQGGAVGPGLKSRSCRTASGTGGLVSRPLGSPEPLGTGRACFSRVSEPSVARTVIES